MVLAVLLQDHHGERIEETSVHIEESSVSIEESSFLYKNRSPAMAVMSSSAKFIGFFTKCKMHLFNTTFLVLNTQFLVLIQNCSFLIQISSALLTARRRRCCRREQRPDGSVVHHER